MRRPNTLGLVLLASATLFFLELHVGQALAPALGGGASVWLTTVLGFQMLLLAGYASASFALDLRRHHLFSAALLLAGAMVWDLGPRVAPSLGLGTVAAVIGLTTVLPLALRGGADVEGSTRGRWIAFSNFGALLGLFAYAVAEPSMGLSTAATSIRVVLVAVAAMLLLRARGREVDRPVYVPRVTAVLSAGVGVYWYMSEHARLEATLPPSVQLWALTLGLYLLSFALPFLRRATIAPVRWIALAVALTAAFLAETSTADVRIFAGLIALFVGSWSAHAALRDDFETERPWTHGAVDAALGGAIAGGLALVVSPMILVTDEQLVVAGLALVALEIARLRSRVLGRVAAAAVAVIATVFVLTQPLQDADTLETVRTWYGEFRVVEHNAGDPLHHHLTLKHQDTVHGAQYLADGFRDLPVTYYSIYSGAGLALNAIEDARGHDAALRFGMIGLGTGVLTTYADANDHVRYFEIDPRVADLSRGPDPTFHYLQMTEADVDVAIGDGRRLLARDGDAPRYDVLVLDAFSGGHVPTHLLTLEAFELYAARVRHDGWIAVHTSNAELDLRPVIYAAAEHIGARAVFVRNRARSSRDDVERDDHLVMLADWIVIGWDASPWDTLEARMRPHLARDEIVVQRASSVRFEDIDAWTDDRRSVWTVWQPRVGGRERLTGSR